MKAKKVFEVLKDILKPPTRETQLQGIQNLFGKDVKLDTIAECWIDVLLEDDDFNEIPARQWWEEESAAGRIPKSLVLMDVYEEPYKTTEIAVRGKLINLFTFIDQITGDVGAYEDNIKIVKN